MMLRSARLALALEQVVREGGFDAVAEFDQVWLPDEKIGIIPFFGTSRMVETPRALHLRGRRPAGPFHAGAGGAGRPLHLPGALHPGLQTQSDVQLATTGTATPPWPTRGSPVRIVPTIYYQGVHGFGASFNYAYRPGEVTLASIGSLGGGRFQLTSAEGQFIEMKPRDIAAPQTFFQVGRRRASCPSRRPGCGPPLPTTTPPPTAGSTVRSP